MKAFFHPFIRSGISFFLALLILVYTVGCTYIRVRQGQIGEMPTLARIEQKPNYFVLVQGEYRLQLTNISMDDQFLRARVGNLTKEVYYKPGRPKLVKDHEGSIIHEVHLYLKPGTGPYAPETDVEIPLADFEKIEVIDRDAGATIAAFIGGYLVVSIIAGIIILITKDSCPYVYANNGNAFVMEGEIYSGAIFKGMERHDYLPLPNIRDVGGIYQVRISNELKEEQHTNLARLAVVNHPEGTRVMMDQNGSPYLISNPVSALEAVSERGRDLQPQMAAVDRDIFLFDEENADTNRLYLRFQKPQMADQGILLLHLKNSFWGDYVYGEFSKKLGNLYPRWINRQNQKPPEYWPQRLGEMGFPLRVYQQTAEGWQCIQNVNLIGPMASRDLVVPVDLSLCPPGEQVRLRLESGFMFWEIDYAAMDFTPQDQLAAEECKPFEAFSNLQADCRASLSEDDDFYLDQLDTWDVAEVHFRAPAAPKGYVQTCFLHTKGYYNHLRDYTNPPELAEAFKFRDPGYFDAFSRQLFREVKDELDNRIVNQ